MTDVSSAAFEDAAGYVPPSKTSDVELAVLNVLKRHGQLDNRAINKLTNKVTKFCVKSVLDEMFPAGKTSYAEFEPRQLEFEKLYRKKLEDYGDGYFAVPGDGLRGKVLQRRVSPP